MLSPLSQIGIFLMLCNVDDDRQKQRLILYVDDFASISDVRRIMLTNRANIGEDGFASNG